MASMPRPKSRSPEDVAKFWRLMAECMQECFENCNGGDEEKAAEFALAFAKKIVPNNEHPKLTWIYNTNKTRFWRLLAAIVCENQRNIDLWQAHLNDSRALGKLVIGYMRKVP